MKKTLLIIALLISFSSLAQTSKGIEVNGKITVENNDVEGITIFNLSSNKGVVTDENGEFKIHVSLNDSLEVRALQYENFKMIVNKAILDSKTIKIFLIEEINKLQEVVINPNALSGSLNYDIQSIKSFNPKLDALYFGIHHDDDYDFATHSNIKIENTISHSQSLTMIHGLNIINVVDQLLLPLFRSEVKDKVNNGIPSVPAESIKYFFGSEFISDNFNIPKHRIEEFIRYVESKDFDFSLLNYGKELELLEVINIKSKKFLEEGKD